MFHFPGEKPYPCRFCGRRFRTNYNKIGHEKKCPDRHSATLLDGTPNPNLPGNAAAAGSPAAAAGSAAGSNGDQAHLEAATAAAVAAAAGGGGRGRPPGGGRRQQAAAIGGADGDGYR